MSRGKWNPQHGSLRGLYRDRENGWIFGAYLISGKEQNVYNSANSSSQAEAANSRYYRVNFGYNF